MLIQILNIFKVSTTQNLSASVRYSSPKKFSNILYEHINYDGTQLLNLTSNIDNKGVNFGNLVYPWS